MDSNSSTAKPTADEGEGAHPPNSPTGRHRMENISSSKSPRRQHRFIHLQETSLIKQPHETGHEVVTRAQIAYVNPAYFRDVDESDSKRDIVPTVSSHSF